MLYIRWLISLLISSSGYGHKSHGYHDDHKGYGHESHKSLGYGHDSHKGLNFFCKIFNTCKKEFKELAL